MATPVRGALSADAFVLRPVGWGRYVDAVFLAAWLRQRLAFPNAEEAARLDARTDPPGWDVDVHGPETCLARPTRRVRAAQAATLWTLAGLLATGPISARDADHLTRAHLAAAVLSLLVAFWAIRTRWGRSEWLVQKGRLTWRRRFGRWRREAPFDAAAIELLHAIDSDGDDRFTLRVRGATGHRTIATALYDPAELAALAEWLSARTGFLIERRSA